MSPLESDDQLIPIDEAQAFIDKCQSRKMVILGMDAFRKLGDEIEPDMDMIADFSELSNKPLSKDDRSRESIAAARRILGIWQQSGEDRVIEFVFAN